MAGKREDSPEFMIECMSLGFIACVIFQKQVEAESLIDV